MNILTALRDANAARQAEWDPAGQLRLAFTLIELGGEVGEALNLVKKLERERLGLMGSRATLGQLAEELADVVICADLAAMRLGAPAYNLGELRRPKGQPDPLIDAGLMLFFAGRLTQSEAANDACGVVLAAQATAQCYDLDLGAAIVAKFNATSAKVGLKTRLDFSAEPAVAP